VGESSPALGTAQSNAAQVPAPSCAAPATRRSEGWVKRAGADESAGRLVVVARPCTACPAVAENAGAEVTSSGGRCRKAAVRSCNKQVVNSTAPPSARMRLQAAEACALQGALPLSLRSPTVRSGHAPASWRPRTAAYSTRGSRTQGSRCMRLRAPPPGQRRWQRPRRARARDTQVAIAAPGDTQSQAGTASTPVAVPPLQSGHRMTHSARTAVTRSRSSGASCTACPAVGESSGAGMTSSGGRCGKAAVQQAGRQQHSATELYDTAATVPSRVPCPSPFAPPQSGAATRLRVGAHAQ